MGWGSPPETPEERVRRLRGSLVGYADAGLFGRLTYTFTGSLLALGKAGGLDEDVGPELLPSKDSADKLAARFDAAYDQVHVLKLGGGEVGQARQGCCRGSYAS